LKKIRRILREDEALTCGPITIMGITDCLEAICGAGPEYARNWIETLEAFRRLIDKGS
jgi:hypothetical protein